MEIDSPEHQALSANINLFKACDMMVVSNICELSIADVRKHATTITDSALIMPVLHKQHITAKFLAQLCAEGFFV